MASEVYATVVRTDGRAWFTREGDESRAFEMDKRERGYETFIIGCNDGSVTILYGRPANG